MLQPWTGTLKVHFPVNVHTDEATFEIQYGNLTRKTHANTSWDRARFESCGQKWMDLSEGHYGVSMLNDCKYGHSVKDSVIGLTLPRIRKFTISHTPFIRTPKNGRQPARCRRRSS